MRSFGLPFDPSAIFCVFWGAGVAVQDEVGIVSVEVSVELGTEKPVDAILVMVERLVWRRRRRKGYTS